MKERNFVVTVKEREEGQPCFLVFETDNEIGVDGMVFLDMPAGTGSEDARALAKTLNASVESVGVIKTSGCG